MESLKNQNYLKFRKNIKPLEGNVEISGDSLISQYALILLSLAKGTSTIKGLSTTEDTKITIQTLRDLGVKIVQEHDGWKIQGAGLDSLQEPSDVLNLHNSISSIRLFAGLLSNRDFTSFITADDDVRELKADYLLEPLRLTGAQLTSRNQNKIPLAIKGVKHLNPLSYSSQALTRQIKDSLLLANLNNDEEIVISEEKQHQNHLEIMMRYLGIDLNIKDIDNNSHGEIDREIHFHGQQEYNAKDISIPGDISLASYLIALAVMVPGSKIKIENVCVNPNRNFLSKTLIEMGARIEFLNQRIVCGEKVSDISVKYGELRGKVLTPNRCLNMIDDFPVLATIAACANGVTRINGLSELDDTDFAVLELLVQNLEKFNIETRLKRSYLEIVGNKFNKKYSEPIVITSSNNYRIDLAMSMFGAIVDGMVICDSQKVIEDNFPNFKGILGKIGCEFDK